METKKAITIGIIALIFIATAAMFAVKIAKKNSSVSSSSQVQSTKTVSKAGSANDSSVQSSTSADPDVTALESDLNSVSEEDFGDASLSDSAVGL